MSNVIDEFEKLHAGVVDWINGKCEKSSQVFDSIYAGRLDADFMLVAPTGHRISKDMVTQYIESIYGSNPDFRIQITDTTVLAEDDKILTAHCLMWHKNSLGTPSPNFGRNISAVFAKDTSMPNGLRWVFAHESPLSEDENNEKEYNF